VNFHGVSQPDRDSPQPAELFPKARG